MSRIVWDQTGERLYETGVKKGVLYPLNVNGTYPNGYAWNGLTGVTESPSGAESTTLYANDSKYLDLTSAEIFGATVEAYTYPPEFSACIGEAALVTGVVLGQQSRKVFGLSYVTTVGNDANGNDYGYKLHLVYGAKAAPTERAYSTINDSPEAITFSWELSTTPVNVTGFKPTAYICIDSTKVAAAKLTALETILYGDATHDPRLPLPDEIATLMGGTAAYAVNNYLVNMTTSNNANVTGSTYEADLALDTGFTTATVIVTMGGLDVTSTAYTANTKKINIASVTGPIVVYAVGKA